MGYRRDVEVVTFGAGVCLPVGGATSGAEDGVERRGVCRPVIGAVRGRTWGGPEEVSDGRPTVAGVCVFG